MNKRYEMLTFLKRLTFLPNKAADRTPSTAPAYSPNRALFSHQCYPKKANKIIRQRHKMAQKKQNWSYAFSSEPLTYSEAFQRDTKL